MRKITETVARPIKNHRVGIACFVFLIAYQCVIVNNGSLWWVNPTSYAFYMFDYSMGFCTKILPGAIYNALVGIYDFRPVTVFVMVFYLPFLAAISFFMEKFSAAAGEKNRNTALVLMFFFLTGPFTIGLFARAFGMLDFYWAFFFAAGLLLLPGKRFKWLLPVCFVGMIFIHYASLFSYAAVLLLLILLFAAKTDNVTEKRQYYLLFAFCALITAGLAAYFISSETKNVTITLEDLDCLLRKERGAIYPEYAESSLFRSADKSYINVTYEGDAYYVDQNASVLSRFLHWILFFVWTSKSFSHPYGELLFPVALALPLAVFLLAILFSFFTARRDRWELRAVALLMILHFFGLIVVSILFTSDTYRWIAHSVTCLFISVMAVLYFEYREGLEKARGLISRIGFPALAIYGVAYALTSIDPYV